MLLTDAVIRIVLRSGHRRSSVLVCQGRWLELPETDLHVLTVSIKAEKEKKKISGFTTALSRGCSKKNICSCRKKWFPFLDLIQLHMYCITQKIKSCQTKLLCFAKDTEICSNKSLSHPCNALSQIRLTLPGIMSHPNSAADRKQKVSAGVCFTPSADSQTQLLNVAHLREGKNKE